MFLRKSSTALCGFFLAVVRETLVRAAFEASHCLKDRPDLHVELPTWSDNDLESQKLQVLDPRNSLAMLARGASFATWPTEAELAAADKALQKRFHDVLILAGAPNRSGICFGLVDVWSRGWQTQYRPLEDKEVEAMVGMAEFVEASLPNGTYCHGLLFDKRPWSPLHRSSFEVQEFLAHEVFADRIVLIVQGSSEDILDRADVAAALRHSQPALLARFQSEDLAHAGQVDDAMAQVHRALTRVQDAASHAVIFITGLPAIAAALMAVEVACSFPQMQAITAGVCMLSSYPDSTKSMRTALAGTVANRLSTQRMTMLNALDWEKALLISTSNLPPWPHLRRNPTNIVELDGLWKVALTLQGEAPARTAFDALDLEVPFPPLASKGLSTKVSSYEAIWYMRELQLPAKWCDDSKRSASALHLHIDACDWECLVMVNGKPLIKHEGGYDPFMVDMSSAFSAGAGCSSAVELIIRAWDPTDATCEFTDRPVVPCKQCCSQSWQPRGKQSLNPGFIMYSGVTGLWRGSPWLELVPLACHVRGVSITVLNHSALTVSVQATCQQTPVRIEVRHRSGQGQPEVGSRSIEEEDILGVAEQLCCNQDLQIALHQPLRMWSTDDPVLYEVTINLEGKDKITQHFGFRRISMVDGRILLNGLPIFMHGVLYQGYWPESLLTPPRKEALAEDLLAIKASGFNTVRVHAVVMGAAFYMLCDEIGLLVWQDMPAGDNRALPLWEKRRHYAEVAAAKEAGLEFGEISFDEIERSPESSRAFFTELQAMLDWLQPFVSIVVWVIFNEGWGQADTQKTLQLVRQHDPSRLIDIASGWNEVFEALGDFVDVHNYEDRPWGQISNTFRDWPFPSEGRARVLGEYGGLGYASDGHEWSPTQSWAYGPSITTKGKFREALVSLVERLLPLICADALVGAIYTQWNDVETEINGLVTYDRVPKVQYAFLKDVFAMPIYEEFSRCSGMG